MNINLVTGLPQPLQVAIGIVGLCIPAFGFLAIAWSAGLLHGEERTERSSWEADAVERSGPWEDNVPNPVKTGGVGEVPTLVWAMACPPGMYANSVKAHGHRLLSCEDLNGEMIGVPGVSGTNMAPFLADRTEVPVRLYEACVTAGTCKEPAGGDGCNWGIAGKESHPINCVDFEQASTFCKWSHKRLCREGEFRRLAGGAQGYAYPWGETPPDCGVVLMDQGGPGCGKGGTASTGSRAAGVSPVGALDAAGNVAEWGADAKARGGSWGSATEEELLTSAATGGVPGPEVGLRCCQSY
ncbi:MAG TPA: SUMF1/EgtB/PvdO family nonheme iron enzyme [Myxococcota bacterium]|nr:SUMF1/EgtB/PvdO family nonheme iron enzyme [Myxococcota bacterium]